MTTSEDAERARDAVMALLAMEDVYNAARRHGWTALAYIADIGAREARELAEQQGPTHSGERELG